VKKNIKLMPPQWIEYPALSEFSMGWRMGAGEDYNNFKNICFKNSENHVGRNLIFVKSMKNNMLRNLV
jgi:hypothetical protein